MKTKTMLQSELVALQALAGDASPILAWPERGLGVAFDGSGNPLTTTLDKAVAVTPKNQHRLIADGSRVNAGIHKRAEAIKTYLPVLEKLVADAKDDPEPEAMTDKAWPMGSQIIRPPAIPAATRS